MPREDLFFNGVSLETNGAYFDRSKTFVKPRKDVEFVSVPGRNGDLSFTNNRFENLEMHFNCYIPENFIDNYEYIINRYYRAEGYQRLSWTENRVTPPETFMMAQYVSATEPVTGAYNDVAQFELVFNCKPQRFFYYGESSDGDTIAPGVTGTLFENPSIWYAYPLFTTEGNGEITVMDSTRSVLYKLTVSNVPTTGVLRFTKIDCELQDAYIGTTNRNPNLTITYGDGFPVFGKYGDGITDDNYVSYTGFASVKCLPRYWKL